MTYAVKKEEMFGSLTYYDENFFKQFKTPDELAGYLKLSSENDKISALFSLYRLMNTTYYDDARARSFDASLRPLDEMWRDFMNGKPVGVCRDATNFVTQMAKTAGMDAVMLGFALKSTNHAVPALRSKDGDIYIIDDFGVLKIKPGEILHEELMKYERTIALHVFENGRLVQTDSAKWLNEKTGLNYGLGGNYFYHLLKEERPSRTTVGVKYDEGLVMDVRNSKHSIVFFKIGSNDQRLAMEHATGAAYKFFETSKISDKTRAIYDVKLGYMEAGIRHPSGEFLGDFKKFEDLNKIEERRLAMAQLGAFVERRFGTDGAFRMIAGSSAILESPLKGGSVMGTIALPVVGLYESKKGVVRVFAGVVPYAGGVDKEGTGITKGIKLRAKWVGGVEVREKVGPGMEIKIGIAGEREVDADMHIAKAELSLAKEIAKIRSVPVKVVVGVGGEVSKTTIQDDKRISARLGLETMGERGGWWVGVENTSYHEGRKSDTRIVGGFKVNF